MLDTKIYTDAINAGTATEETYVELLRTVFAPNPLMVDTVVNLFVGYYKIGLSLQDAFDKTVQFATNTKIDPNSSLNNTLDEAKASDLVYNQERQKIKDGGDRNDAIMQSLYQSNEDAWMKLYRAIDQSLPIRFLTEDGGVNTIETIASMTSDRCLYYSTDPTANLCTRGVVLSKVVRLEKV